jgi:hypothetical protein
MPELFRRGHRSLKRAARVAYAFVLMNYVAVAALGAVLMRKKVWR